jgi:hypothetical protein
MELYFHEPSMHGEKWSYAQNYSQKFVGKRWDGRLSLKLDSSMKVDLKNR